MEHLALYREWRPQLFRDVIGQEHICRTLRNAVCQGRVAHAYLLCGPRGTGKTSTARILAKAVNCPNSDGGEPCNTCVSCQSTTAGVSMDVIEMDAASHRGIEEIRDLNQKACFAPTAGKFRLFIVDEVHMLTGEAFNALLKTLEEPPRHVIFVLATTEAHKVPLTIASRCQRFDFRRLGRDVLQEHLRRVAGEKGWQIDDEALQLLSRRSGGALRDALGMLEQAADFTGGVIGRTDLENLIGAVSPDRLRGMLTAAMAGEVASLLQQLDGVLAGGCEPRQILYQLIDMIRERLFAAQGSAGQDGRMDDQASGGHSTPGPDRTGYVNLLRDLALAEADLKGNSRPDLVLELALVRFSDALAQRSRDISYLDPRWEPDGASRVPPGDMPLSAERTVTGGSELQDALAGRDVPEIVLAAAEPAHAVTDNIKVAMPAVDGSADVAVGEASRAGQSSATADLVEMRKSMRRCFQKQPIESQDLSSCKLVQDGNKIILKVPSAFQQERLLKEESRRKLLDAVRQFHPALELEIVTDVQIKTPAQRSPGTSPGGAAARAPGKTEVRERQAEKNFEGSKTQVVAEKNGPDPQGSGADDPVGVALTLFNGKIIDETEVI